MCGLAGWFDAGPAAGPPPGQAERRAALAALAARGPDGEGVHAGAHFGLLHRRLAVVDREGGAQPMAGPREHQWLAWNGELFDHAERRRSLQSAGETFATRSDSEVLAHLLAKDGARALDTIRAQFAVAWIDGGLLLLARDPAGEKPLFWRKDGDRVFFASTLAALRALSPFPREIDREALSLYLSWGFVPAPRTIWAGVKKLAAGATLTVTRDGRVTEGRIAPEPAHEPLAREECAPALRAALADAARIRLTSSDVPVGVFLSGGLDSIAIATVLRDAPSLRTFTVRSLDPAHDESAAAARVAGALGIAHEIIDPPGAAPDAWRAALLRYGEPFAATSAVAIDAMAAAARRRVTVVLTGDGGDEAMAGYDRHRLLRRIAKLPRMPSLPLPATGPMRRFARAFEMAALPPAERYASMYEVFGRWRPRLFAGDDGALAKARIAELWGESAAGDIAAMLRVDRAIELPDSHCVKVDVACMGNGVEARAPWLDRRVVAVCDAMPRKKRISGGQTKRALREMLRREMPAELADEVTSRKKRGFTTGFDEALRADATRDLLLSGALGRVVAADTGAVERLWREHRAGRGRHTFRLFVLVALALFAEESLT